MNNPENQAKPQDKWFEIEILTADLLSRSNSYVHYYLGGYIAQNGVNIMNELETIWEEVIVAYLKYYPPFPWKTDKIMNTFCQVCQPPKRDLKPGPT